jgi:hypothetical protein
MRAEKLGRIIFTINNIGSDGCLALSKANWRKISSIDLGNCLQKKEQIQLEIQDANGSASLNGIISNIYPCVSFTLFRECQNIQIRLSVAQLS